MELFIEKAIQERFFECRGNFNFAWAGYMFLAGREQIVVFLQGRADICFNCLGTVIGEKTRRGKVTFKGNFFIGHGKIDTFLSQGRGASCLQGNDKNLRGFLFQGQRKSTRFFLPQCQGASKIQKGRGTGKTMWTVSKNEVLAREGIS